MLFSKKMTVFLRPLKNNKAVGIIDVIYTSLFALVFTFVFCYWIANVSHVSVQSSLHSNLENMVDIAIENRELTSGMQSYFTKAINNKKWYSKHYVLHVSVAEFSKSNDSIKTVASYTIDCNGNSFNDIKLQRSQILTITLESKDKTLLNSFTHLMPHTGSVPDLAVTASFSGIVK